MTPENEEALKVAAWFDLAYSGKDIPISAHIRRLVQENEEVRRVSRDCVNHFEALMEDYEKLKDGLK